VESEDKQRELRLFMDQLLDQIKKAKHLGEKIDWIPAYADKFIEVLGQVEAKKQAGAIGRSEGRTKDMMKFCSIISDKLHETNKKDR